MWYGILPSLGGMAVGLWGGYFAVPICHWITYRCPCLRFNKGDQYCMQMIRRDNKLAEEYTGKRYSPIWTYGFEALVDENGHQPDAKEIKANKNKYFLW